MTTLQTIDDKLRSRHKTLRTRPNAFLLGPTGARLWADYLDPLPGFSGRFDFIHKVNIPLLYTVKHNGTERMEPCHTEWRPSHFLLEYDSHRLTYSEKKFITWDDCAVSCQTWHNRSNEALYLQLHTDTNAFGTSQRSLCGHFSIEHKSYDVSVVIAVSDAQLVNGLTVNPGESKQLIMAAACGLHGIDTTTILSERAASYAQTSASSAQLVSAQSKTYGQWFAKAPVFTSSDRLLDQTWLYRWFILRHNLADPKYGYLQHPLFYEGRSHKKDKEPFTAGGWEFSKLINLSVPHHIMDARWYHDPTYCQGSLQNMHQNQNDDHMFSCLTVDKIMHSFANFSVWAAYQLYTIHRNEAFMEQLLPALKQEIRSNQHVYGTDKDELKIEWKHTRTGKEYQPSYWYFHNFPKNPKDKSTYTHLKRVDRTIYHYLNVRGIAKLCHLFGDPEANVYNTIADQIKEDVLHKMWDESTQFFYDLHYKTDEKARVKNIVGFYPAWAEMIDDRHNGLITHMFDPSEFYTDCPLPTVSADCPVYAPGGGWQGAFIKGKNGCVWNGPTWPYTNAIALDALARESKRRNHAFDNEFAHLLHEYSFLHFRSRDLHQPNLVEHYDSRTGEAISDEPEYNHSYYIDLIITHVAGLSVQWEYIILDPIDIGLDYFHLHNVKAAGKNIRITYRRPGTPSPPEHLDEGYALYVNDKRVFFHPTLCRKKLSFKEINAIERNSGIR